MTIIEVPLQGTTAKVGSLADFGTMSFIESAASTELTDGREVKILRGAVRPFYFEIKIDGKDEMLRIDISDMVREAIGKLEKL